MGHFLSELKITPLDDGILWRVDDPFDYDIGAVGGEKICVPIGFLTDLGSVPQLFWNVIPPIGKPLRAYVLHDWLYWRQLYTRSKSDSVLMEAMGVAGVSIFKRWVIYGMVRSWGWIAWKNNAAKKLASLNNTH